MKAKEGHVKKRSRPLAMGDAGWSVRKMLKNRPSPSEREALNRREHAFAESLAKDMHNAEPVVCEWLSEEKHVLPDIVNIVYAMDFKSEHFTPPVDLIRIAQYVPMSKYRPSKSGSISVRLSPTTGMFFGAGNIVVIRSTSESMARYYAHLYRRLVEKIPMIMREKGRDGPGDRYIGTLEGYLGFSLGRVENLVGSGVLPQDGVNLTKLLNAEGEKVEYDPDAFPNGIYYSKLSDGTPFTANVACTGKVVLMGLKKRHHLYEAYHIVCDEMYNYEDPNVPTDPKRRFAYRMKQLKAENKLFKASDADINRMRALIHMGEEDDHNDEMGVPIDQDHPDGEGDDDGMDGGDGEDTTTSLDRLVNMMMMNAVPVCAISAPKAEGGDDDHDNDEKEQEPLLFKAVASGQLENVEFMLGSGGEMAAAVWLRDENGLTIADRIRDTTDVTTRRIYNMISRYMEKELKSGK